MYLSLLGRPSAPPPRDSDPAHVRQQRQEAGQRRVQGRGTAQLAADLHERLPDTGKGSTRVREEVNSSTVDTNQQP